LLLVIKIVAVVQCFAGLAYQIFEGPWSKLKALLNSYHQFLSNQQVEIFYKLVVHSKCFDLFFLKEKYRQENHCWKLTKLKNIFTVLLYMRNTTSSKERGVLPIKATGRWSGRSGLPYTRYYQRVLRHILFQKIAKLSLEVTIFNVRNRVT